MTKCLLSEASLNKRFWEYAMKTAVYIRNRCLTQSNELEKTPYEIVTGVKPNIDHMRVFGCVAYVYDHYNKKAHLQPRGKKGIFIGYALNHVDRKSYYILVDDKIEVSRDVIFDETKFGNSSSNELVGVKSDNRYYFRNNYSNEREKSNGKTNYSKRDERNEHSTRLIDDWRDRFLSMDESGPRRSGRTHKPIARFPKELLNHSQGNDIIEIDQVDNNGSDSVNIQIAQDKIVNLNKVKEPENYYKVKNDPYEKEWRIAMNDEISSLERNGTWKLISKEEIPKDRRLIKCKWVYKIKQGPDGDLDKFKARLCAKGFTQIEGVDYDEVFSPVLRHGTIRLLLSLAAINDWDVKQMDVITAFLNPKLDEDIYMEQPLGFEQYDRNNNKLVCHLKKSIYGLKQAAINWNNEISNWLKNEGFMQSL